MCVVLTDLTERFFIATNQVPGWCSTDSEQSEGFGHVLFIVFFSFFFPFSLLFFSSFYFLFFVTWNRAGADPPTPSIPPPTNRHLNAQQQCGLQYVTHSRPLTLIYDRAVQDSCENSFYFSKLNS